MPYCQTTVAFFVSLIFENPEAKLSHSTIIEPFLRLSSTFPPP